MSLLMDALRRAEQEKKEQQAREDGDAENVAADVTAESSVDGDGPGADITVESSPAAESVANPGDDTTGETGSQTTTVESPYAVGSEDVTMQIEPSEVERASETADFSVDAVNGASLELEEETLGDTRASDMSAETADDTNDLGPADQFDGDTSRAFALEDGDTSRSMTLPSDLSLEPMDGGAAGGDVGDAGMVGEETHSDMPALSDDLTGGTTVGGLERSDQTSTMPSTRAVENDLTNYFDRSQSMEMPRSARSADLTLEDVAAHTVVGAQTVFSAGERPRSRRVFLAATVVAVVIVLAIAIVGIYYAQQSPGPRYVPPPTVADGVERPVVRELPVVPLEPAVPVATETPEIARVDTVFPDAAEEAVAPDAVASSEPVESAAAEATAMTGAVADVAATNDDTAPAAVADSEAPAAVVAPAASDTSTAADAAAAQAAAAAAMLPPEVAAPTELLTATQPAQPTGDGIVESGVGVGQLTISRARKPAAVDSDVAAAYSAFQAGDFDGAATHYRAVIDRDPENRDARLGLGAIAMSTANYEAAYEHYATVLRTSPGDAVASAAMFGITGGQSGINVGRIRVLLDQHKDSPYLNFALGNWYAGQGRWGEAQQAYFDAARLDAENPDYAYNLAVSLEHLGQAGAALDFYQRSLGLADNRAGNFNSAVVLERINALSAAAP